LFKPLIDVRANRLVTPKNNYPNTNNANMPSSN
jgi:hypothetical protein